MEREIKPMEREDIEKASEMFYKIYKNIPFRFEWLKKENVVRYINDTFNRNNFLGYVLLVDGVKVGYCLGEINDYFKNAYYEIDEIFIVRNMQGEGHGTFFITEIEGFLAEKKLDVIKLNANKNFNYYDFYKKNGFVNLSGTVSFIKRVPK